MVAQKLIVILGGLIHGIFRQSFSEARESRMIWRVLAERNTKK
jgi:hypothetical protein